MKKNIPWKGHHWGSFVCTDLNEYTLWTIDSTNLFWSFRYRCTNETGLLNNWGDNVWQQQCCHKYCWRKRDECVAVHCSLFAINFRAADLCVHWRDRYPDANPAYSIRRKTCSWNMANTFYTLFAVRRFFIVSSLLRCCSQIVYNRLYRRSQ